MNTPICLASNYMYNIGPKLADMTKMITDAETLANSYMNSDRKNSYHNYNMQFLFMKKNYISTMVTIGRAQSISGIDEWVFNHKEAIMNVEIAIQAYADRVTNQGLEDFLLGSIFKLFDAVKYRDVLLIGTLVNYNTDR